MTLFASFEGIEASGKSAVMTGVSLRLTELGITCSSKLEFPPHSYFHKIYDALSKSVFISEGFTEGSIAAFFYMLYSDTVALQCTDLGCDVLLADRFVDSVAVYQGYFTSRDPRSFDVLPMLCTLEHLLELVGLPVPDMTFLLDVPVAVAAERFRHREKRPLSPSELDAISSFHRLFRTIARQRARYRVIDASDTVDMVIDRVLGAMLSELKCREESPALVAFRRQCACADRRELTQ